MKINCFVKLIENSIKENWDLQAFSDYQGESHSYADIADKILFLHTFFKKIGLKKGDKISIIGKNSVNWATTYLATVTYGTIIVPILPDFKASDVHHIVNHSDSKMLFADNDIFKKLDPEKIKKVNSVLSINDFDLLYSTKNNTKNMLSELDKSHLKEIRGNITPDKINFNKPDGEDLAAIVYTSGTTGFSKGVMLPHRSLLANIDFAIHNLTLHPEDTIVSFLPIAHVFGCAFEFLFPFCSGCHITFLNQIPSPKIIIKAFNEIKPNLILSVPLIIEKIYKKQIKPTLDKPLMKILTKLPILKNLIYKKINKKLSEVFGGEFQEIVIGGAALNEEVEKFLRDIHFRFTVGYGMTECGPLISYSGWKKYKPKSTGKLVDTLDVKIDSQDPYNEVGEIMVKGKNVMHGYYKYEEATDKTLLDGWLKTGDLGIIDNDNFIYIKGRSKSMILGPSGKNIYPEELEAKLNNLPFISESIVVDRKNQLIALIYPDFEKTDDLGISEKALEKQMEENRKFINKNTPNYMRISKIEIYPEEFEKTPKKSIKRFLYSS